MQINTEYLSVVALVVSIASAYYTKKQCDSSEIASYNNYRAQLSSHHDKYRVALKLLNDKHKEEISHLSQEAENALNVIVKMFDQYDVGEHKTRHLSHLVGECSELVYFSFREQLGWQTGLNISHRFFRMTHMEDCLEPENNYSNQEAFPETKLMGDKYFCSLFEQIKDRIDFARKAELLLNIQMNLGTFNALFKALKPRIGESVCYLDKILVESDLEHFKLRESSMLYERLIDTKTKLDTLSHLQIQEIGKDYADKYYNYVSLSIYTCAILHSIQDFHSWGWQGSK